MSCPECYNTSDSRYDGILQSYAQRRQFERSIGHIVGTALVSMNVVSLIANVIILVVLFRRGIHSRTAVIIINLGINDILLLCLGTPWKLAIYTSDSFPLGDTACKVAVYALMLTLYVEVYTLLLLALLRYLAIAMPFSTAVRLTNTKVYVLVLAVWIISLLVNIPAGVFATLATFQFDEPQEMCIKMAFRSTTLAQQIYGKCHFLMTYTVPLVVIFALLCVSINKLNNSRTCIICERRDIMTRKVAIYRLVILTVTYAICELPINIMSILRFLIIDTRINSKGFIIAEICAMFFAFVKCSVHPILYNCMAKDFRRDAINIIKRQSTSSSDYTRKLSNDTPSGQNSKL